MQKSSIGNTEKFKREFKKEVEQLYLFRKETGEKQDQENGSWSCSIFIWM